MEITAERLGCGNYLIWEGDGAATCLRDMGDIISGIYSVGESLSVGYDHPQGIVLSEKDVDKLGLVKWSNLPLSMKEIAAILEKNKNEIQKVNKHHRN